MLGGKKHAMIESMKSAAALSFTVDDCEQVFACKLDQTRPSLAKSFSCFKTSRYFEWCVPGCTTWSWAWRYWYHYLCFFPHACGSLGKLQQFPGACHGFSNSPWQSTAAAWLGWHLGIAGWVNPGSIGWMLPEKPVVNVWGCLNISHHKLDFTPEISKYPFFLTWPGKKCSWNSRSQKGSRHLPTSNWLPFSGSSPSPRPIHMELSTPLGGCGLWYAEPIGERCLRHDDGQMFSCRESRGVGSCMAGYGMKDPFQKKDPKILY